MLEQSAEYIEMWIGKVKELKGIYTVMNMFDHDVSRKCLLAECWVPSKYIQAVSECITRGTVSRRLVNCSST